MNTKPTITEVHCPDLGRTESLWDQLMRLTLGRFIDYQPRGTRIELARWMSEDASDVQKDQVIAEIETDKVALELPAPCKGMLVHVIPEGQFIQPQDVVAVIES